MLDQVGQARTKPGPVGASWGQLGQAAASCAPPVPTGNGLAPCWEPNRSQTGTRPAQIGARLETVRSPAGASLGQGRGKVGARPGQVRHCPDPTADRDGTGNPRLPPASGCHIRRLNRAIGPKSLIGHMPRRAPDSYGRARGRARGASCSDGWLLRTA